MPEVEDLELTTMAASLLPEEPWDNDTYQIWMNLVKTNTTKKGKELFHPIRKALTAQENGPELKVLLPFIGRKRALRSRKRDMKSVQNA
jgi:glutamyl-tRNA synthetase